MKKQWSIKNLVTPIFMFMIGFGLIAGCGDRDSETVESDDTAMSEQQTVEGQQTMDEVQSFEATLDGSNEVPAVTTDATGSVTVTLEGNSIHVKGQFSGLSSEYIASHIHKAARGENGGPIQSLEPTLGSDKLSGSWDATYQLDESQISALKADSLYINVHSAEHKPGEIRGQLTSSNSGM